MNTKSHFWLASSFYFRQEKREVLCDCCGTGRAVPTSKYSLSNVKLHSGSVLQSLLSLRSFFLSPSLLLPSISVREWKGTFWRKFHRFSTKTPSFITEEAAVNTILTYKNKPAKGPQPNPCGLDVNVWNYENMYYFILNVSQNSFWVPQWQTSQLWKITS